MTATGDLAATAAAVQRDATAAGLTVSAIRAAYERATTEREYSRLATTFADTRRAVAAYRQTGNTPSRLAALLRRVGAPVTQDGPSATAVAVAIDQARPLDAIDNLDAARDAARRELVAGAALVAGAVVLAGLGGVVAVRRRERRAGSAG
ncbi:MAG: hypothetical protein V9G19_23855 [Tetrasphaera sp.]